MSGTYGHFCPKGRDKNVPQTTKENTQREQKRDAPNGARAPADFPHLESLYCPESKTSKNALKRAFSGLDVFCYGFQVLTQFKGFLVQITRFFGAS